MSMNLISALLACCLQAPAGPGDAPLTRAEQSDYAETSSYTDVMGFLEELEQGGAPIRTTFVGETTEGRLLPLVIAADPPVATPEEARASGKVVVYLQANIHGGEVEGKEAVQELLRDGPLHLDRLILLVAPIYNLDGNEAFGDGVQNRGSQNGPARVGQRANGQGLDLNRDAIKAESPEMRAMLDQVYNAWDPLVTMDLHTTNGTRHGFVLTYAPPLNPNTAPGVMALARDRLLPAVRAELGRRGMPIFDYGNARGGRWGTYGQEGRYVVNYLGLRNRIGILSEATTYLPFRRRVEVTRAFVDGVLGYVAEHADDIQAACRSADETVAAWGRDPSSAPDLGVRFEMVSRGQEPIPLEVRETATGRSEAPGPTADQLLEIMDRFQATHTARLPAAYAFGAEHAALSALLGRHGIPVERLAQEWSGTVQEFVVSADNARERPFQGHVLHALEGSFRDQEVTLPAGTYLVRTAHPLALLAFHILEPESRDGAATWEVLGDSYPEGSVFPVRKLMDPAALPGAGG